MYQMLTDFYLSQGTSSSDLFYTHTPTDFHVYCTNQETATRLKSDLLKRGRALDEDRSFLRTIVRPYL